jgi:hypothetical protein
VTPLKWGWVHSISLAAEHSAEQAISHGHLPISLAMFVDASTLGNQRAVVISECRLLGCAVKRRRFPVGESPTRQLLQPGCNRSNCGGNETVEAFGEAVTKYGDSASVQAVTRVNAEQASKRTMRRLTRILDRGKLIRLGKRADDAASRCAGVVATACTQGKAHATREAPRRGQRLSTAGHRQRALHDPL